MSTVHMNDIGTQFIAQVVDQDNNIVDISTASQLQMIFKKPSGIKVAQSGVLYTNGTDGKMEYITQANDLNEHGLWKLQGYVVNPSGAWYSDQFTFPVARNL